MIIMQIFSTDAKPLKEQLDSSFNYRCLEKKHLKITPILELEEFTSLKEFISNQNPLPFHKLSLDVDLNALENNLLIQIIQELNKTDIEEMELVFTEQELNVNADKIKDWLLNQAQHIIYPFQVHTIENSSDITDKLNLKDFQSQVIHNIQERNKVVDKVEQTTNSKIDATNFFNTKINLKSFINYNKTSIKDIAQYIPLEIQHVTSVAQEINQQYEQNIEVQNDLNLNEIEIYSGPLLGYADFSTLYYKNITLEHTYNRYLVDSLYDQLRTELFANLPEAIKYISPGAAENLAKNLANFVTLNKENLPDGYFLKKTISNEYILDYDAFFENENTNHFTPVASDIVCKPIYEVKLPNPSEWLKSEDIDSSIAMYFEDNGGYSDVKLKQLTNIWIKYDNVGLKKFLKNLTQATRTQPLLEYILEKYLSHFSQWDNFYDDEDFFNTLKYISYYEEEKLNCLKYFLNNTGASCHDLYKTVNGFNYFWEQLKTLCTERKVDISLVNNNNWSTKIGNPVVYMERILIILQNSRRLDEQFEFLKNINFSSYEHFYASRYEGFKTVCQEMELNYVPDVQDKEEYNTNFKLYRLELGPIAKKIVSETKYYSLRRMKNQCILIKRTEELPEHIKPEDLKNWQTFEYTDQNFISPYHLYSLNNDGSYSLIIKENPKRFKNIKEVNANAKCFRFIGIQSTGISVKSIIIEIEKYTKNFCYDRNIELEFCACLFFITHERFIEKYDLQKLLSILLSTMNHLDVILEAIILLENLYSFDIKLNQEEGCNILAPIAGMNSCEFESLDIDKNVSIRKLLTRIKANKFAALKYFDYRININKKWPFIYAIDTVDFLEKDQLIATTYRDDLFLFSGLINTNNEEVYYNNRSDDKKEKISQSLTKVKDLLHLAAASEKPNNLYYAIQLMINAKRNFTFKNFINACADIAKLTDFNAKSVKNILENNGFKLSAEVPKIIRKDEKDLKTEMTSLIIELEIVQNQSDAELLSILDACDIKLSDNIFADNNIQKTIKTLNDEYKAARMKVLSTLSLEEITNELAKKWEKSGVLLMNIPNTYIKQLLETQKEFTISSAFVSANSNDLLQTIAKKIDNLPEFQNCTNFENLTSISDGIHKIANLIKEISENIFVIENNDSFISVFNEIDFSKLDYETLFGLLSLLTKMPQRNYLQLLDVIFKEQNCTNYRDRVKILIKHLEELNNNYFPSEYLAAFSKLEFASEQIPEALVISMINTFYKDNKDPILKFVMNNINKLTTEKIQIIFILTDNVKQNRQVLSKFLDYLLKNNILDGFLVIFEGQENKNATKILEILSKAQTFQRVHNDPNNVKYLNELAQDLQSLSDEQIQNLHDYYANTPLSISCLSNATKRKGNNNAQDITTFLSEFEKEPFGIRNLEKQFSIDEVERVVNQSKDMLNNTVYSYEYRKKWMEAFLFVNAIGNDLPVYDTKTAKELSNSEIKVFFASLKSKVNKELDDFTTCLLGLGLIREAMYRATGEFPYSTQVIALIDAIMHKGDLISNIDTGQGKSLIDCMKSAVLYLKSDRVDVTTSSIVDAKRDIINYGAFMKLLGIPYSEKPIIASSSEEDFKKEGINFSTVAQLSLFFAKSTSAGIILQNPETKISLVLNESDYSVLDDQNAYRLAAPNNSSISKKEEWIYYEINKYVTTNALFKNGDNNIHEDIKNLKEQLKHKAKSEKNSSKIIDKFSDSQYASWLNSAYIVNYQLYENYQYVIPATTETKIVNGITKESKVVKILMRDGKVSPDSMFGNGIQQLLYAKLNKERNTKDFIIEPQNTTIIATNNTNFIDYYLNKNGFIWGSSGTVGSQFEILEQFQKYGFEFSKIEPHQKNIVKFNKPIVKNNEDSQFLELITMLITNNNNIFMPKLVFFKDINTATKFFNLLSKQISNNHLVQLYTGLGNEEEVIDNASKPQMITIATSAIGRNTNILYDKTQGLCVYHTFIDSIRRSAQKSGRTGRQGSPGEVNFIFNGQEIGDSRIEEIQNNIDRLAAENRKNNDKLYIILCYMFRLVAEIPECDFNKTKSTFFQEDWSKFNTYIQEKFEEIRNEVDDQYDVFIDNAINTFNEMLKQVLKSPIHLKSSALERERFIVPASYMPYTEEVAIEKCTPPIDIAYNIFNTYIKDQQENELSNEEIKSIKDNLSKLFENTDNSSSIKEHANYINYLYKTPNALKSIVNIHKQFLAELIDNHSQKLSFVKLWLGYEGNLSTLAGNRNYLLTFYALSKASNEPIIDVNIIKKAVNTLLDEYLETSWFIRKERKEWAKELKELINNATDINEVIAILSKKQVDIAQKDIETNKNCYFKPLHFLGTSRFQNTISKSLNLATSLSGKPENNDVVKSLKGLLHENNDVTLDDLKSKPSINKIDASNASVIINAIENAISIDRKHPSGMIGRPRLRSPRIG